MRYCYVLITFLHFYKPSIKMFRAQFMWDLSTSGPVMVFLGDILRNNSNITSKSLGEKERALLCVVPNQGSDVNADFLRPNGTVIEDTPHLPLYVSKGDQIVRLNSGTADGNVIDSGKYCCTVSSQDRNYDPLCVHLV